MANPYKQVKQIAKSHSMNSEEVLHALLATIYTECCDKCNDQLHSEHFLETFQHLLSDLEFCKSLSTHRV
ncbi:MAG: hypothetical protein C5B54_05325 [Acidobacteria bacterium]|nr:MAG: hypothetical protein C5B54_05325 [Acidobacteriota bacterium]